MRIAPTSKTSRLPTLSSARPAIGITATNVNAPSAATKPAATYERPCAPTSTVGMKKSEPSKMPMRISSAYVLTS